MSLEIGDATLTGLKHVQKLGGAAKQLIQAAFQTAVHGATEGAQPQQGTVAYKEAFASCMTLIFEAARHDAAVTDVQSVLEDASFPSDATAQFSTLYTQHKDALRFGSATGAAASLPSLGALSSTGVPSIVDVSWRLDDYLRSDSMEQIRQPSYLITLTTTTPAQANGATTGPATTPVAFSCNFQELQDLLAKLKDAQKQIQQRVE